VSRQSVLASLNLPPDPIPNLNPLDNPKYYTTIQSGQSFLNAAGLALIGGPEGKNLAQIPGTDAYGNFLIPNTQPVLSGNGTQLGVDVGPQTFFGHAMFFTNGTLPANTYTYTPGRSVFFNFNRYSEALPDSERWGGFVNFDHKVCGDQLLVYGDFFYQDVK